jgi:hypothetical protein
VRVDDRAHDAESAIITTLGLPHDEYFVTSTFMQEYIA